MKTYTALGIICILSLAIAGCSTDSKLEKVFDVDGVSFNLVLITAGSDLSDPSRLMSDAKKTIVNRLKLIQGEDSELSVLNRERGPMTVSTDFYSFLEIVNRLMTDSENTWEPRVGVLRSLWGLDSGQLAQPDVNDLKEAVASIPLTRINLNDNNQVHLTGEAVLDLARIGIAWAVDGAADVLIEGGARSGKVTAEDIYRIWSDPADNERWSVIIKAPFEDTQSYRIEPEAGGVCVIDLNRIALDIDDRKLPLIFDPASGMLSEASVGVTVWDLTAVEATAYAEGAFVLGRDDAMAWISAKENAALFIFYKYEYGYASEADPRMAQWLNAYLP